MDATNSSAQVQPAESPSRSAAVGLFSDRAGAEEAIAQLRAIGFATETIGVTMHDSVERDDLSMKTSTEPMLDEQTHKDSPADALDTTGSQLPGGLVGFLSGDQAAGGNFVCTLSALGVSEETARRFESAVEAGGALVTVNTTSGNIAEATAVLNRCGADVG